MLKRLAKLSKSESFFLFGARGTGKTTLVKELFLDQKTIHLDLLDPKLYLELSLEPASLKQQISANLDISRVIIDEVQKIPALLDVVHQVIESPRKIQFILTGSSARKLKRGGANLLAGRAFVYNLFPLCESELENLFSLEEVLSYGSLPKVFQLKSETDKQEFLRAYTNTYLREEILQEQLIRKLEPFQRFLPIAAQVSGELINFNKISKDVGVASQTIENYFHILEDTLLGFFLPAYHPSIRKQENKSSRFYLFDLGVKRALSNRLEVPLKPGNYEYGKAFEHIVVQELYRLSQYLKKDYRLYHYRTQAGLEVDIVLERPGKKLVLIEIKSTTQIRADHLKHICSIKDDLKADAFCLSQDDTHKLIDGVRCLPWQDGLRELFMNS